MKPERRGLVLVVVVVALSAALGGIYGANVRATASSYEDTQSAVRSFTRVLDAVEANYAEKVDVDKIVYQGAIPGMLRVLDPHSSFFDARQWASNLEDRRGRYYGVGMTVIARGEHTVLMSAYVGNPGGLLDEAIAVGDMLLDKGQLIVSHRGRASAERRYYALRGNQGNDMPLVILVNNNSASATEIVAGAVQDHDRGVIVGGTTFGKGLVQTLQPLSENTGLALTIARYYTPSGRLIQRDYKSISLLEYYERKIPEHPTEVRLTDSGRQVTGGGGITPDITVHEPESNHFEKELFRTGVFFPLDTTVGGFTRHYLGTRPTITKDFAADDAVMADFRKYLSSQNVRYTEPELAESLEWVKRKRSEERRVGKECRSGWSPENE